MRPPNRKSEREADQRGDDVSAIGASFNLDRMAACFLQDATGVLDRFLHANLVAQKRHVRDDQRAADRSNDDFRVVDYLIQRRT